MLGKLLKHEFRETSKLMLSMYLILTVITAVGAAMAGLGLLDHMGFFASIFMMIYVLSVFSLFLLTAAYLAIRFYKTVFAGRGYLTHTLPVSPSATLNAKVLTSLAWLCLSFLMCILSFLTMSLSASGPPNAISLDLFQQEMSTVFGMSFAASICLLSGLFVSFCFHMSLMVFASLSIGQLFQQYRIPAAIGAGIAFYVIQQIIFAGTLLASGIDLMENMDTATHAAEISGFVQKVTFLSGLEMLLFGAAYYVICLFITKKRLNLE